MEKMGKVRKTRENSVKTRKSTKRTSGKPANVKPVFWTICAVARNEGRYLAEWLTFHHLAGADRFIIILHQSN